MNRPAVEAGLALLEAGETFVSFDRQAVELVARQGQSALVPERAAE